MTPLQLWIRNHRTEIVLAAIAFALYVPGIGWGLPYANDALRTHGWATDAITPLEPVSQIQSLLRPSPDRWVPYPLMHAFLLAGIYAPYLLYLLATGGLSKPGPQFPFGLADPVGSLQVLELLGKSVTLCMAAGIIVAVYRTAKTLWGHTTGVLAAVFTMLLFPMFYYSRTGNIDVPVLFWTSLGLMMFAQILEHGFTSKRAVWLGLFAAFAIATKDQGWAAFVPLPPILAAVHMRRAREAGVKPSWRPAWLGLLASVVAFSIMGGLVISPERFVAHVEWIRAHVPFPEQEHFPATLGGYVGLLGQTLGHLADANGPLMLVAAVAGLIVVWRREPLKLALFVPAVGHFFLVLVPIRMSLLRYVMLIALVLCLFAARGLAEGLKSAGWIRTLSKCGVVAICGWLLVLGTDLTYQMWEDSHYPAAAWLDQHTQPGDEIATVAATACLPRLKPGIKYLVLPRGSAAEQRIAEQRPNLIIIMPDWSSPKNGIHPARFPAETYRKLVDGSLGYRQAARFKNSSLITRQILDYPSVNPPIEIYARSIP